MPVHPPRVRSVVPCLAVLALGWVGCRVEPPVEEEARPMAAVAARHEAGRVLVSGPWAGAAEVAVSLVAWGDPSTLQLAEAVEPEALVGRTSYDHGGLVEVWEEGLGGLEQSFVVDPEGADELVVDLRLEGAVAEVDDDGLSATWTTGDGPGLRYEGLAAWDGSGVALPSRMEATALGLRLVVDTAGALGLVTVDPVFPGSVQRAEANQPSALFGHSVASAGDVNGDGFDDVLVGAHNATGGRIPQTGQVFLYLGSASGLQAPPAWTATGDQALAAFGSSVASAGDVNADGFDDVVIGSYLHADGQNAEGKAFLYLGSATGLQTTPAWTAEPDQALAAFGSSVASAGDVNGDGFDDVLVGAPAHLGGGRAFLYLGSAAGLEAAPVWTAGPGRLDAFFGNAVASAGDVNADGFDDVVVGSPGFADGERNEGEAVLYLGSVAGLALAPAWTAQGNVEFGHFGSSVAPAGDVNGDGYADLAIGAQSYDHGEYAEGAAFVYLGSAAGLQPTWAWLGEADQELAFYGQSVASAGDVNADGYADLVVGAPYYTWGQWTEGKAFLYLGSAAGLGAAVAWTAESNQEASKFGVSVASAGDIDGDGFDDVGVGAELYSHGQLFEGAAALYRGR